jgi:hypothetical protein
MPDDELSASLVRTYSTRALAEWVIKAEAEVARLRDVGAERDHWHRCFNALDAAVNHHFRDQGSTPFASDADARLYAARQRVYRRSAAFGQTQRRQKRHQGR